MNRWTLGSRQILSGRVISCKILPLLVIFALYRMIQKQGITVYLLLSAGKALSFIHDSDQNVTETQEGRCEHMNIGFARMSHMKPSLRFSMDRDNIRRRVAMVSLG